MNYTFATVIVAAADRAAAQAATTTEYFNAQLSPTGDAPATHYFTSGPFGNNELDVIVNDQTWAKKIYFGPDAAPAIEAEGLKPVVE